MTKVNLPPGCGGFTCADGTRYDAKPGSSVTVDDRHAKSLKVSQYSEADFISADGALSFGTKRGQRCEPCNRTWNAWNTECPRCGNPTTSV
jgi:hypothetical protein